MNPRRTVVVSIALVALIVLAGCVSSFVGDSPESDPPATTVKLTTSTPTLDDLSLPDGATDERIKNGSALAAAHAKQLSSMGHAVELIVSNATSGESATTTYAVRRDAETGELSQRIVRNSSGEERRQLTYTNESGTYVMEGTARTSSDVRASETGDEMADDDIATALETFLQTGDWTNPSVVRHDARTFVEYHLDAIAADSSLVRSETVTNASGSVLVDEQGVVHRLALNVTQERDGTTSQVRYEYRVAQVGDVSVEKPDWVRTAVEQAGSDDERTNGSDGPVVGLSCDYTSPQVSNRVVAISTFGSVVDGRVETISLHVMLGACSDDIDLSTATIEWVGPERATVLTGGDTAAKNTFAVEPIKDEDGSTPILNSQDDRFEIVLDATEISSPLGEGALVDLKITTQYGAVTLISARAPEGLSGDDTVTMLPY